MKFSKAWLQSYIQEPLPENDVLRDVITENAFEVEGVESFANDTIFDIKILPNRAPDCLGHKGLAKEIATLCKLTFSDQGPYYNEEGDTNVSAPVLTREDTKACSRFMSVRIDGVTVGESPAWLKERLEALGERSINSIVDITNYVQFSINKPMHAYDAVKIKDDRLFARYAQSGEELTTLDGKVLTLTPETLVIASHDAPLGLAGIKGGKDSGISDTTSSIILESANFDSTLIRKTRAHYGIRTEASKRFENKLSDTLVEDGIRMTIALIKQCYPNVRISTIVDSYDVSPWKYTVSVSVAEINGLLGTSYTADDIKEYFHRFSYTFSYESLKSHIEKLRPSVLQSSYKNPSSMRADAPRFFSCSSLISYLYSGVWQPSISIDKYVYGKKVEESDLKWGDLVFSNSGTGRIRNESVDFLPGTHVSLGIDHVGMYVGDGTVFHISSTSNTPTETHLGEGAFPHPLFARIADCDEERFFITVPDERLDVRRKEDIIEEIARVGGLSTIPSVAPTLSRKGTIHKRLYYETLLRNIFYTHGFSEIYTYTFGDHGDVRIQKALMDKTRLRNNLSTGLIDAFTKNLRNAPLLQVSDIRLFEMGTVFTPHDERRHVAFTLGDGNKKRDWNSEIQAIMNDIKEVLPTIEAASRIVSETPFVWECDLDEAIKGESEDKEVVLLTEEIKGKNAQATYVPYSPYPFIVRDISVWVPEGVTFNSLKEGIDKVLTPFEKIIARPCELFDSFTKEGKTSYAFKIVLQSREKTLTDEEANDVAEAVYSFLRNAGYDIR